MSNFRNIVTTIIEVKAVTTKNNTIYIKGVNIDTNNAITVFAMFTKKTKVENLSLQEGDIIEVVGELRKKLTTYGELLLQNMDNIILLSRKKKIV